MGFKKKQLIKFKHPKTFAYRADIDELQDFLMRLLTDEELCDKMGQQGRKHVVENLNYKYIANKMLDITNKKLGLAEIEPIIRTPASLNLSN